MFYFLNNSAKEFIEFTLLTLLLLIKLFAFVNVVIFGSYFSYLTFKY